MKHHPTFAVIIPAAGSSTRFGGGDKLLSAIADQTVLLRSILLFLRRKDVAQIIVVAGEDRIDTYQRHLAPTLEARHDGPRVGGKRALPLRAAPAAGTPGLDFVKFIPGGRERWESVLFGLRAVQEGVVHVAIHDAARPLTPREVIDAAFAAAVADGGSVPCIPEPATLKRANGDGKVGSTVDRQGLFQAQTPQCFDLVKIRQAYEDLLAQEQLRGVTDDAQVFEKVGHPVAMTTGSSLNIKITTPEDITLANGILSASRRP